MREPPCRPLPSECTHSSATLPLSWEVAQLVALVCFFGCTRSSGPRPIQLARLCPIPDLSASLPCWDLPTSLPPICSCFCTPHLTCHLGSILDFSVFRALLPSACREGVCAQLSEGCLRRRRKGGYHLLLGDCAPTFPAPIECFQGNLGMWSVW